MALPGFHVRLHRILRAILWAAALWFAALACPALLSGSAAWAQDFAVSAKVDKTTTDLGNPITLTVTFTGDLTGLEVPSLRFPEEFAVAARSQATNFAVHGGVAERAMSLTYVLVPQREGTFALGPFPVTHKKQTFKTEPIDITVKKPAVPPDLQEPQGGRFSL